MCVLRDTYLIDDPAHREPIEDHKPHLRVITTTTVEVKRTYKPPFVTTHFYCRTCKQKTPVEHTRSCTCGMIMCVSCWNEWEVTCPICDNRIG